MALVVRGTALACHVGWPFSFFFFLSASNKINRYSDFDSALGLVGVLKS